MPSHGISSLSADRVSVGNACRSASAQAVSTNSSAARRSRLPSACIAAQRTPGRRAGAICRTAYGRPPARGLASPPIDPTPEANEMILTHHHILLGRGALAAVLVAGCLVAPAA